MSLKLTSPHKSRERILAFGGAGSGKTYNWFQIANHTPDTTHLFVLDTDSTVMPYLESEEFSHLDGRLEYVDAQWIDWPDWVKTVKNWQSIARPDDWLIVDMFGHA